MKLIKKSCKYIDITDVKTILPYVEECLRRHKRRRSMRRMLKETFAYDEAAYQRILHSDEETIWAVAEDIAEYIAATIKHRYIRTLRRLQVIATIRRAVRRGSLAARQHCSNFMIMSLYGHAKKYGTAALCCSSA